MKLLPLLALVPLLFAATACAQSPAPNPASDGERAERILQNLRFEFPQLAGVQLEMNEISSSQASGFDRGSFTINGQQTQDFLISQDDTQLYLIIGDPIDASRDAEGLTAAETARQAEAEEAARARAGELSETFANLPVRGNPNAPITIIEFSDFQCSFCGRAHSTLEQVLAENDDVRLIYVQFPLPNHAWGQVAARASLCAAQQSEDAFWTLHDYYFANQGALNPGNVVERSRATLAGSDVNMEVWNACTNDPQDVNHQQVRGEIDRGMAIANDLGVSGTPAFFINGRFLNGAQPKEVFDAFLNDLRAEG